MAFGFRQDIKDSFPSGSQPVSAPPKLSMPPSMSLAITPGHPPLLNENGFH
jgi:hypothetical protein